MHLGTNPLGWLALAGDPLEITYVSITDTATASDTLGVPDHVVGLSDTATASDVLGPPAHGIALSDTATASDTLGADKAITVSLSDTATASDTLRVHLSPLLTDTATASDTLGAAITTALSDTATASDTLTADASITVSLSDTATASDTLDGLISISLSDTATASDTLAAATTAQLSDTATASDTLGSVLQLFVSLSDTATASDTLAADLHLVGILSDTAYAGDVLYEQRQQVLVINADTGAVSEYVFTPTVKGLGEFQGTLYLATNEGLFALDAADDDGTAIGWEMRTGFTHLGTDRLKRVNDVNTLLRAGADTALMVVINRTGEKKEHHYKLVKVTRDAMRDGVTKVGKGLQSVYWQFGYKGVNEAEIDEMRIYLEALTKRR